MPIREGRCTNFGNCRVADSSSHVHVPEGVDFICPECHGQLSELPAAKRFPNEIVAISSVLIVILGFAAWWFLGRKPAGGRVGGGVTASGGSVVLRLHGSNTIGAQLAPALAAEFLKQQGAAGVKSTATGADEVLVEGTLPGESSPKGIEIQAHGSATAFSSLADGTCDIGMASRRVHADEAAELSSLGDLTSPACEHVLGVDGIAVIVNRGNTIATLSKEQIAQIFSGAITDWARVQGSGGQINVYARDDKSGTYDTFKTLVLGTAPLTASAKRFEDSRALSDAVAADAGGIGFIGLPYVRDAKAIAVADAGARALLPNRLTIATEDYALARRLFLYTPAIPQNSLTRRFVEFALSKQGQDIVESNGFVGQNVQTVQAPVAAGAPSNYQRLTEGAQRMSLDFRFRTGSADLDNKALADLDRVVTFLTDLHYTGQNILLFGFADSTGSPAANDALSKNRAQAIAQQFQQRGVTPASVTGFGAELPVASNATDDGRARNRRVEIWLKK